MSSQLLTISHQLAIFLYFQGIDATAEVKNSLSKTFVEYKSLETEKNFMNFIDANKSQHCPENAGIFIIVDLV